MISMIANTEDQGNTFTYSRAVYMYCISSYRPQIPLLSQVINEQGHYSKEAFMYHIYTMKKAFNLRSTCISSSIL